MSSSLSFPGAFDRIARILGPYERGLFHKDAAAAMSDCLQAMEATAPNIGDTVYLMLYWPTPQSIRNYVRELRGFMKKLGEGLGGSKFKFIHYRVLVADGAPFRQPIVALVLKRMSVFLFTGLALDQFFLDGRLSAGLMNHDPLKV